MRKTALSMAGVLGCGLAGSTFSPAVLPADVIIGAGRSAAVHYKVGRAICRQFERGSGKGACEVLAIEGRHAEDPLAVLSDVRTGAIEAGLVQSDWQFHAHKGSGPVEFMDVKFDNVRSMFSLHGEPFTLVARGDADIASIDDLVDKRVNIGNPGSSHRTIMDMIMKAKGWTHDTFAYVDELPESEQYLALCHNRVQAVVATVSHPNPEVAKALELCNARLVQVTGGDIDELIGANPYFARIRVPGEVYGASHDGAETFGVTVTAVTSEDTDEDTVYAIIRHVFDNLDGFRKLHRSLADLRPESMVRDGLSAPLHPGASRYFREKGLMQ